MERWGPLLRRARYPALFVIVAAVTFWDASGWDAPLVGESPFSGSDDETETTSTEPQDDILGEWEGEATVRRADKSVNTYTVQLTIDSLEPGEVSGEADADFGTTGHCGGSLTLEGKADGGYRFSYSEEDNPGVCVATTEVFLAVSDDGELRYQEAGAGYDIEGTLTRAGS